jgi:hypothetical protein
MLHLYLGNTKFWRFLERIDERSAADVQSQGCVHCGGRLHRADYPRKPRGVARRLLGESDERRASLCCAREGCRRRTTPESVRFLGRRVYPGALVVLVSALVQGLSVQRERRLCQRFGARVATVRRWRQWWREHFPATPWWRTRRGLLIPPPPVAGLPATLLAHFGETGTAGALVRTLRWLAPISVSEPTV